ncbi:TPA: hypothetical protein SAK16_001195 [Campylobacter coli]|nr:hypothetical protein [Campylobacter coli]HEG6470020.1 hypothetical protein [Campylobacter coli]
MQININLEEMTKWQITYELKRILSSLDPITAHEIAKELRQEFLLQDRIRQIND